MQDLLIEKIMRARKNAMNSCKTTERQLRDGFITRQQALEFYLLDRAELIASDNLIQELAMEIDGVDEEYIEELIDTNLTALECKMYRRAKELGSATYN